MDSIRNCRASTPRERAIRTISVETSMARTRDSQILQVQRVFAGSATEIENVVAELDKRIKPVPDRCPLAAAYQRSGPESVIALSDGVERGGGHADSDLDFLRCAVRELPAQPGCEPYRLPGSRAAQQIICMRVKGARVPSFDAQITIAAATPVSDIDEARPDTIEIRSTFDRIRNRCEVNVRRQLLDMLNGGLNVFDLLAFVAPHQEHADLNSVLLAKSNRIAHLLNGNAALHGVENALRAALRTDPNAKAAKRR